MFVRYSKVHFLTESVSVPSHLLFNQQVFTETHKKHLRNEAKGYSPVSLVMVPYPSGGLLWVLYLPPTSPTLGSEVRHSDTSFGGEERPGVERGDTLLIQHDRVEILLELLETVGIVRF